VLAVHGCGGTVIETQATLSCDTTMPAGTTMVRFCTEYDDFPAQDAASLASACTGFMKGTVGSACATAGSLGVCTFGMNGVRARVFCYPVPSVPNAEVSSSCHDACGSFNGTWTAGG
jgi:hypothetical protein